MANDILNGTASEKRDRNVPPLPCPSSEPSPSSYDAALLVSRRLDYERYQREATRHTRRDRSAWAEITLAPTFEAAAAALRAAGVPSAVEHVNPWLIRLRIGDARRGDVERWVEINVVPNPVCITARVGRIARFFPACNEFPLGGGANMPGEVEVGAWLETMIAQMFA